MKKFPIVSVNIRTFNSAKTLHDTLKSVKGQTYPNIEIAVSDGHSRDVSVALSKKFGARVDYSDNLGDARYQNYLNSRGKYIISLDSDQIMDKKLIKDCVELCENENFNALIISEKSLPGKKYLEKIIAYDKWVIDQSRDTDATFGTACPRFFKRDLLGDIKWPKGLGIFDDTILYSQLLKKGAKVAYVSQSSIRHHEVSSWWVLTKKFYRYGKSYFTTFKQNPTTIAAHSLPRRSYFSLVAFSKPNYFFGLLILYFIKALAASTGVAAYFMTGFFKKN